MIDAPDTLRDFLLTKTTITALIDTRIWAELDEPPVGYKPSQGGAIVFKARGGAPDTTGAILRNSWQFKCYGADVYAIRAVYRALADVLHDATLAGASFASGLEVAGQMLTEPRTNWPYMLSFFETWMRSGLPTYTPT